MLDKANGCRHERRSALIEHDPSRLDIDIADLSEVRLADEGNFQEVGDGYTLFWPGKPSTDRRLSGVGFMVRNSTACKLETSPTCNSDGIIFMLLPLKSNQHLTHFSCYAPTPMADTAVKNRFYSHLRRYLNNTSANDNILVLGDFNARVGRDSVALKGARDGHGVGNCNDNGCVLLEFGNEFQLAITNTIFQQKDRLKTTGMHPRFKHLHLLDYVHVRQRDQKDVLHMRAMSSAESCTDHHLVR